MQKDTKTQTTKCMQDLMLDRLLSYHTALKRISMIQNKHDGGDWDEIEEARTIAEDALND